MAALTAENCDYCGYLGDVVEFEGARKIRLICDLCHRIQISLSDLRTYKERGSLMAAEQIEKEILSLTRERDERSPDS